ncbi:unnamed protein product [Cyprideis torosa]|uniref:Uncharacterized protein n=1 Tax=Cyprideis torosa TaxID=163714 RepID=A0A7R8ZMJ7_9CRUS|nr:unnamed protein product [Cyprideis torosa]CAG0894363.1 unnamed protein product [Cyprideis torosa]
MLSSAAAMFLRSCCLSVLSLCLLFFSPSQAGPQSNDVAPSSEEEVAAFHYPPNVRSEYELEVCSSQFSACNIVHRRYWLPLLVERLCQCPDRTPCPYAWTEDTENPFVIWLNNHSQFRFCSSSPMQTLTQCNSTEVAAQIITRTIQKEEKWIDGPTVKKEVRKSTQFNCFCPKLRHWSFFSERNFQKDDNMEQIHHLDFTCVPLDRCRTGQFCGNIRRDLYSTYYHCTCPPDHYCITRRMRIHQVQEMHFNGTAFKGFCHWRSTAQGN